MGDRFRTIRSDHGLVTAELAVSLPAVVGILLISLTIMSGQVQAAQLQQFAAVAAHSLARSESERDVKSWVRNRAPRATLSISDESGVLCATVRQSLQFVFALDAIAVSETACAWVGRKVTGV